MGRAAAAPAWLPSRLPPPPPAATAIPVPSLPPQANVRFLLVPHLCRESLGQDGVARIGSHLVAYSSLTFLVCATHPCCIDALSPQALLALGGLIGFLTKGSTASLGACSRRWGRSAACHACCHCSVASSAAAQLPSSRSPMQAAAWALLPCWPSARTCRCSRTTAASCAAAQPSCLWVRRCRLGECLANKHALGLALQVACC